MNNNFYFWVFSDASADIYPSNTISNFRNHVHTPIELESGMYEVALVKCSYIYTSPRIKKGEKLFDLIVYNGQRQRRDTPPNYYTDYDGTQYGTRNEEKSTPQENSIPNKVTSKSCYATRDLLTYDELLIQMNKFDKSLKFTTLNNFVKVTLSGEYNEVLFTEKVGAKLGFTCNPSCIKRDENGTVGDFQPYFQTGETQMFIYSNIVKPQYVGNMLAPLMRMENYAGEDGKPYTTMFEDLQYLELSTNLIENVHMYIKSEVGADLPFTFGKFTALLHFRKKIL